MGPMIVIENVSPLLESLQKDMYTSLNVNKYIITLKVLRMLHHRTVDAI